MTRVSSVQDCLNLCILAYTRSVRLAEWLALSTLDHKVLSLNPAGGRIQLMTVPHLDAHLSYFSTKTYVVGTR